jgi:hypothetical protein
VKNRQTLKAEERQIASAIRLKKIDYVNEGRIAEVQWNKASVGNSSWRDEWITIMLSAPLVLIFGPDAIQEQIAEGFKLLELLPAWYKSAVGLMIGSAFGYQKYTNTVMNRAYSLPNKIQSSVEALNEADKA